MEQIFHVGMVILMSNDEQLLKDAVSYFSSIKIYDTVFKKFLKKYKSLGHFGGTIKLPSLTSEDKLDLSGFFQKPLSKINSISFKDMEKALENSRFCSLTWEEIFQEYFNTELLSNKEKNQIEKEQQDKFFKTIIDNHSDNIGISWFKAIIYEKQQGNSLILQKYKNEKKHLKEVMDYIFDAISNLPRFVKPYDEDAMELLPIFSAKITGDPHYFDEGTTAEKIFTLFLKEFFNIKKDEFMSPSEYKNKIWYEGGILLDELSNDVLIYGICGKDKKENPHLGLEYFSKKHEPLRLTLFNLQRLKNIFPIENEKSHAVYIVENPAIFSVVIKLHPKWSVICGNGQVRRAVLMALDLFPENCCFYYSGDYDPEGLVIAQKLKNRYGDRLIFWNYNVEFYKNNLSDVYLNESRLKKLNLITSPELLPIKTEMLKLKKAMYQEQIIDKFF